MRLILSLLVFVALCLRTDASPLKSDETLIFFPSYGWRTPGGYWNLEVRGWVYEQEKRPGIASALLGYLGMKKSDLTADQQKHFDTRAKLFLIDGESGKEIAVQCGNAEYPVGKTDGSGYFAGVVRVRETNIHQCIGANAHEVNLKVVGVNRTLPIQLVPTEGLSVISDIDDTIKISEVIERQKLLRNTFFETFNAVPGMAGLYRDWETNRQVTFHYVSASPNQLYLPLSAFVATNGFPAGTFHLRNFDWRKQLSKNSKASVVGYKESVIDPLMRKFPDRKFILVGDSGERDPEIYGAIARKFPEQIYKILIRNVTNDRDSRYLKCFEGVPRDKWQIFKQPAEIIVK